MFTSWARHAKLHSGTNESNRAATSTSRQALSLTKSTAFNIAESLISNKPKGRRLSNDCENGYVKAYNVINPYDRDRSVRWGSETTEDTERKQYSGIMTSSIPHHLSSSQVKMRVCGPSSSGTALSATSYHILLPQKSSPSDQNSGPVIKFPPEAPTYPLWSMSMSIPQSTKRLEELRRKMDPGPASSSLVNDQRLLGQPTGPCNTAPDLPSIMVDPYSSSAREFIASRQLMYLTRRRMRPFSQEPHVWIVNYYGRAAAKAIHSKVVPGSSLTILDTVAMGKQQQNFDQQHMTRLLGCHEVDDNNPIPEKGKLRFLRLIGRGGTSAVYSGLMEICWENAMLDSPSPVVAKILNPKHWKCALAELVASAAAHHRVRENTSIGDRRRSGGGRVDFLSPSTLSTQASGGALEQSPFVQGGVWLMPTELHLFWDLDSPVSADWTSMKKKKIDTIVNQPRFSQNDVPALCCLVLRNCEDGVPLLTWLNTVYVKRRRKPSHEMCAFFAYTVITLVRQLHTSGLIHGDIKPDNFVLLSTNSPHAEKHFLGDVQVSHPLMQKSASGVCPVTLAGIDFGRSLDVKESLKDVIFIGDTQVSDFRCPAMLEKSRWETQIDLTGLAVTIFTMISLKYPKIRKKKLEAMSNVNAPALSVGEARGKVTHSYWFGSRIRGDVRQNEFWLGLLDRLINFDPFHTSDGHTLLDSCLLLRQLEKELINLFGYRSSTELRASYEVLYNELNEMHEFVMDYQKKGGVAGPVMI